MPRYSSPDIQQTTAHDPKPGGLGLLIVAATFKILALALPAVLVLGLFLMAVVRWRETAQQARCREHLRQLVLMGLWHFGQDHWTIPGGKQPGKNRSADRVEPSDLGQHEFPPATIVNSALMPEQRLSWYVTILPYLGREELYRKFDLTVGWQDEPNRVAAKGPLPVVSCPTHGRLPGGTDLQTTSYVGSAGLGLDAPRLPAMHPRAGFLRYDEGCRSDWMPRGLSYTIALLETHDEPGPWTAGGRPTARGLDTTQWPYFGPGRQFGGHPNGGHAAFADGSVRFHFQSDSARILERLIPLAEPTDP